MNKFSNGIMEFANSAVCSDLLANVWDRAVPPTRDDPTLPVSVTYKGYKPPSGSNGATIIAFMSSPAASTLKNLQGEEGKQGLASSPDANFQLFEFVCTKLNPSVSINKTALDNFASIQNQLSTLKDQIDIKCPLIITGVSLGGSVASLFTLWLLDTIYLKTSKFPLCITFGSPLLGDNSFQQAISERSTWISCFLHVISNQDPVPRFFASSGHMPFGTTLFLSDSGCACFDEPESVLHLIKVTNLENHEDMQNADYERMLKRLEINANLENHEGMQNIDYGRMLKRLKNNASRREIKDTVKYDINNPLQAGITLQLAAIGAINKLQENSEESSLITQIEKRLENIQIRKISVYDQANSLNDVKIWMTYMEWYKKVTKTEGGYYDSYKTVFSKRREEIVKCQGKLTQYWKHMVDKIEKMPKREAESKILSRWLYGGTIYRRMVEPLDIAAYYMVTGNTDYINKGRSDHYKLLEQWEKSNSRNKPAERSKVSSLTEDTCFWARVEEALIVCILLEGGNDRESLIGSLIEFEKYVMGLIKKLAVSPEIFEEKSSFMKWWKDFKKIQTISYKSELTAFMNNEKLESEFLILDEYIKLT